MLSYTTRLFRTCQLLVQLTLKDKRCPPSLATAKSGHCGGQMDLTLADSHVVVITTGDNDDAEDEAMQSYTL